MPLGGAPGTLRRYGQWPDPQGVVTLRQRGVLMAAVPPTEWTLPDLRVDVDGEWWDDDVQITHPGVLANLRGNLRRDGDGYFIQTRVRIPVAVDDVPFVVTRVEPRGDALHA